MNAVLPNTASSLPVTNPPILDKTDSLTSRVSQASTQAFQVFLEFSNSAGQKLYVCVVFVLQTSYKIGLECAKATLIAIVIFAAIKLTVPAALCGSAITTVIVAPVLEEILFRGILLTGVEFAQKGYNQVYRWKQNYEPSAEDLEAQKIFRVRTTAFIFGLVHLTNHATLNFSAIYQVTSCTISGLSYGYLKEKTNSIALPIIGHARNNAIAFAMQVATIAEMDFLVLPLSILWAANKYNTYQDAIKEDETTENNPVEEV